MNSRTTADIIIMEGQDKTLDASITGCLSLGMGSTYVEEDHSLV